MVRVSRKLTVATAMLLVATLMLGAVTYAWFTLSTSPEVSGMKVNLAANQNLEIALDNGYTTEAAVDAASQSVLGGNQGSTSGNPYTWGNQINLDAAMRSIHNPNNEGTGPVAEFIPILYSASNITANGIYGAFEYAKYGADGRISGRDSLTSVLVSDFPENSTIQPQDWTLSGGVRRYVQFVDNPESDTDSAADVKTSNAYSVSFWVRSNEDTNLTVTQSGVNVVKADSQDAGSIGALEGDGTRIRVAVAKKADIERTLDYLTNVVIRLDQIATETDTQNHTEKISNVAKPQVNDTMYLAMNKADTAIKYYSDSTYETEIADLDAYGSNAAVYITVPLYVSGESSKTATGLTANTSDNFALSANKASLLVASMYLDGSTITNKDALLNDINDVDINIQFQSSAIESGPNTGKAVNSAATPIPTGIPAQNSAQNP